MDEKEVFEDFNEMTSDSLEGLRSLNDIISLRGKAAVVVGGACGLGYNVVNRLGEAGASIIIGDISVDFGTLAEKQFKDKGYDVIFVEMDVKDINSIQRMVDFAEEKFGKIDILVNTAAVWMLRPFLDISEADYDILMDTVEKGTYFVAQRVARSMIRKGIEGKIVNIASVAAFSCDTSFAMLSHYNTAKGGVVIMTKALARELNQYGIRVNCVAPGAMNTLGAARTFQDTFESGVMDDGVNEDEVRNRWVMESASIPKSNSPDEVALMVFALCTDMANFMVGETVVVDGGAVLTLSKEGILPKSIR